MWKAFADHKCWILFLHTGPYFKVQLMGGVKRCRRLILILLVYFEQDFKKYFKMQTVFSKVSVKSLLRI